MATGKRDKAARRAVTYETAIRELQASGNHRDALHKAWEWLSEEAAKVRRQRPQEAPSLDTTLADRLMRLAAEVPNFRPGSGVRRVSP